MVEEIAARARVRTAGAGRHAHRRGVGTPRGAAARRGRGVPGPEREERRDAKRGSSPAPGRVGAVTISTNMAGRGTDIRLGGDDEPGHERVPSALGGLYVIGTNRHESRRVDLQLRGRAGRQGDPGESRFFVSLEDDLLVRYGIHGADRRPRSSPDHRDEPIDHPVLRREIARAQRIIEGQNLEIRKTLWRYASVIEEQRRHVMDAAAGDPARSRSSGGLERRARAHARAGRRRPARTPSGAPSGR